MFASSLAPGSSFSSTQTRSIVATKARGETGRTSAGLIAAPAPNRRACRGLHVTYALLNVLGEKAAMEVIPDGVVHKSLLRLWFSPRLPFEDHIVIPSVSSSDARQMRHVLCQYMRNRERHSPQIANIELLETARHMSRLQVTSIHQRATVPRRSDGQKIPQKLQG